jgi:hypothetical protein
MSVNHDARRNPPSVKISRPTMLFVLEGAQHRRVLTFAVVQPELMCPGSDQEDLPLALQAIFRNDVKQ